MEFLTRSADLSRQTVLINCLRAVAALSVFFAHADAHSLVKIDWLSPYRSAMGEVGVYVFFVLSGFLIWSSASNNFARPDGMRSYWINRATRILPLYLANIAFMAIVFAQLPTTFKADITAETILRHLTFTQALNPSVSRAINPVLWTLTHEAMFYALVPLLFVLRARLWPIIVGSLILHAAGQSFPALALSPVMLHCPLFAAGIIFAETKRAPTILLALALLLLACVAEDHYRNASIAFAIVAAVVAGHRLPIWRWWPVIALSWIGVISYSLYIWHYVLIEMIGPNLGPILPYANWIGDYPGLRGVATTAICIGFAAISFFLIEYPTMGPVRRWLLRRGEPMPLRPADAEQITST